jgi:hypothetical protein
MDAVAYKTHASALGHQLIALYLILADRAWLLTTHA